MDETDFRLLAALVRDALASSRALGASVHMTGMGVQRRLGRMAAAGVLEGFAALPAAPTLGRALRMWDYPEPARAVDLHALLEVEDVAWVVEWHDGTWRVHLYSDVRRAGSPPGVDRILGAAGRLAPGSDPPAARDPRRELSPLDWRIIAASMDHARAPATELSRACGLSPRVVRKRRAELIRRGDLQVVPLVAYAAARGVILYTLTVEASGAMPAAVAAAASRFGELLRASEAPPTAYYFCHANAFQEVATQTRLLESIPGVTRVEARFPKRRAFAGARLAGWVRARNEAWEVARRAAPRRDRPGRRGPAAPR